MGTWVLFAIFVWEEGPAAWAKGGMAVCHDRAEIKNTPTNLRASYGLNPINP